MELEAWPNLGATEKSQLKFLVPKKDITPTCPQSSQSKHLSAKTWKRKGLLLPLVSIWEALSRSVTLPSQAEILSNPCAVWPPPHVLAEPCLVPLKSKSGSETKASAAGCLLGQSPSCGCTLRPPPDSLYAVLMLCLVIV